MLAASVVAAVRKFESVDHPKVESMFESSVSRLPAPGSLTREDAEISASPLWTPRDAAVA